MKKLVLLLIVLVGCGGRPSSCRTELALFEDHFNDSSCGWDERTRRGCAGTATG